MPVAGIRCSSSAAQNRQRSLPASSPRRPCAGTAGWRSSSSSKSMTPQGPPARIWPPSPRRWKKRKQGGRHPSAGLASGSKAQRLWRSMTGRRTGCWKMCSICPARPDGTIPPALTRSPGRTISSRWCTSTATPWASGYRASMRPARPIGTRAGGLCRHSVPASRKTLRIHSVTRPMP